jgi:hypothetical protein
MYTTFYNSSCAIFKLKQWMLAVVFVLVNIVTLNAQIFTIDNSINCVKEIMLQGNTIYLSKYFTQNVHLKLGNQYEYVNNGQAVIMINDYAKKLKPESFNVIKQVVDGDHIYCVANIRTAKGLYNIYFTLLKSNNNIISEINITPA